MYVCGLTPSGEPHLGHARSFLFFDVFRRYLRHLGYKVTYVQNVTDIDDRSIEASRQEGRPWHEIVERYYSSFKRSMRRLGVAEPDVEPRATEYIPQILTMIEELVATGHAYAERRRRLLSRRIVSVIRQTLGRKSGRADDRRTHPREREEAESARFRPLEIRETRRAVVAFELRPGPSGMAYRVLGDGTRSARRAVRYSRRRRRSDLPASRERDRAKRVGLSASDGELLGARRPADVRAAQDVEISRQLRAAVRASWTAPTRKRFASCSCRPAIANG